MEARCVHVYTQACGVEIATQACYGCPAPQVKELHAERKAKAERRLEMYGETPL